MQFDANPAPALVNPIPEQEGSSIAGEIDLYDELLAFMEMTPEEKRLYLADRPSVEEAPEATLISCPDQIEPEVVDQGKPERVSSPVECLAVHADSTSLNEKIEVTRPVVESPDAGDPLVDLNLDRSFNGVLTGKTCLACGAKSEADDLFCMSCGSFLNGVASTSPSKPTCSECSQAITIDEIFCPWCGSVLAPG